MSVAVRARTVEDDLHGLVFLVFFHEAHQAEGVEKLGGDVGEDAGTLGGDAVAYQEEQEPGQELVDLIGGVKLRELPEEIVGKILGIFLGDAETGVAEAEAGSGVHDGELAGASGAGEMATPNGGVRNAPCPGVLRQRER